MDRPTAEQTAIAMIAYYTARMTSPQALDAVLDAIVPELDLHDVAMAARDLLDTRRIEANPQLRDAYQRASDALRARV